MKDITRLSIDLVKGWELLKSCGWKRIIGQPSFLAFDPFYLVNISVNMTCIYPRSAQKCMIQVGRRSGRYNCYVTEKLKEKKILKTDYNMFICVHLCHISKLKWLHMCRANARVLLPHKTVGLQQFLTHSFIFVCEENKCYEWQVWKPNVYTPPKDGQRSPGQNNL